MAARKSGASQTRLSREPARKDSDASPNPSAGNAEANNPPRPALWRFATAGVTFALWAAVLVGLTLFTANPVTFNRAQILSAPVIAEATFDADRPIPQEGRRWHVQRTWPPGRIKHDIAIEGIVQQQLSAGQAYLIPVEPVDAVQYRIVRSPEPFAAPLVYPANPETITGLESILNQAVAE